MAKFSEQIKEGGDIICDACKKTFPSKEIKLVDPPALDNVTVMKQHYSFIFVDKSDEIVISDDKKPTVEDGDKVLSCPLCDAIHLVGMRTKSIKEEPQNPVPA